MMSLLIFSSIPIIACDEMLPEYADIDERDVDTPSMALDVFRFSCDDDDYDLICDQTPVILPPRWQVVLGNVTGVFIERWRSIAKFFNTYILKVKRRIKNMKRRKASHG